MANIFAVCLLVVAASAQAKAPKGGLGKKFDPGDELDQEHDDEGADHSCLIQSSSAATQKIEHMKLTGTPRETFCMNQDLDLDPPTPDGLPLPCTSDITDFSDCYSEVRFDDTLNSESYEDRCYDFSENAEDLEEFAETACYAALHDACKNVIAVENDPEFQQAECLAAGAYIYGGKGKGGKRSGLRCNMCEDWECKEAEKAEKKGGKKLKDKMTETYEPPEGDHGVAQGKGGKGNYHVGKGKGGKGELVQVNEVPEYDEESYEDDGETFTRSRGRCPHCPCGCPRCWDAMTQDDCEGPVAADRCVWVPRILSSGYKCRNAPSSASLATSAARVDDSMLRKSAEC